MNEKLDKILKDHVKWLYNKEGGKRADLTSANLRSADLSGANLRSANLRSADLSCANLRSADLSCANLRSADLSCANLSGANLRGADLSGADLSGADLSGANLRGADLRGADLSGANLRGADLSGADLRGADLNGADLNGANLSGADLRGADLNGADLNGANLSDTVGFFQTLPSHGSFTGWKKAQNNLIVKLLIPENAKRSSSTGRKCRCDKAEVLEIQDIYGNIVNTSARSTYNPSFIYEAGKTLSVSDFDNNRFNECAPGIHFYVTREEAVEH